METEQFNIRVSRELIRDLETISNLLKINKSEWVKARLAKEIYEEKNRLLLELSTLYANGMIDRNEIENLVGAKIAEEMEFIKKKSINSVREGAEFGRRVKKRKIRN